MLRVLAFFLCIIFPNVSAIGKPLVPCYFVFGDSLSDAGNNNNLITAAKANYVPYGIDFPKGTTGRFTNGRTYVDVLTEILGFQGYIAPFTQAQGQDLLKGVNYASGGAGIRPETSKHLGDRIMMDLQLKHHAITIAKLGALVQGSVGDYLSKCLYTVNIGSNDYINNYFKPMQYPTKRLFTIEAYATQLVSQYFIQLKALYLSGARKVAVSGLGQIGCTPAAMLQNNATQCVAEMNQAVDIFNQKIPSLIDQLNLLLPGAKFTFIDMSALQKATPSGGYIIDKTCCKLRSDYQCDASAPPCPDRKQYAYMDGYHTTEAVNILTASTIFKVSTPFVHPVNISTLIST